MPFTKKRCKQCHKTFIVPLIGDSKRPFCSKLCELDYGFERMEKRDIKNRNDRKIFWEKITNALK